MLHVSSEFGGGGLSPKTWPRFNLPPELAVGSSNPGCWATCDSTSLLFSGLFFPAAPLLGARTVSVSLHAAEEGSVVLAARTALSTPELHAAEEGSAAAFLCVSAPEAHVLQGRRRSFSAEKHACKSVTTQNTPPITCKTCCVYRCTLQPPVLTQSLIPCHPALHRHAPFRHAPLMPQPREGHADAVAFDVAFAPTNAAAKSSRMAVAARGMVTARGTAAKSSGAGCARARVRASGRFSFRFRAVAKIDGGRGRDPFLPYPMFVFSVRISGSHIYPPPPATRHCYSYRSVVTEKMGLQITLTYEKWPSPRVHVSAAAPPKPAQAVRKVQQRQEGYHTVAGRGEDIPRPVAALQFNKGEGGVYA